MTAQQVAAAGSYARVPIDPARLLASDAVYSAQLANKVIDLLKNGHSVLACTTKLIDHDSPTPSSALNPRALATACGHWLAQVLEAAPVQRLGIAGGDTSSHAVQALDAWGLSYLQSFSPGVALCRLHSDQAHLNGMEIILKGGQMGATHLFEHMLHGM